MRKQFYAYLSNFFSHFVSLDLSFALVMLWVIYKHTSFSISFFKINPTLMKIESENCEIMGQLVVY